MSTQSVKITDWAFPTKRNSLSLKKAEMHLSHMHETLPIAKPIYDESMESIIPHAEIAHALPAIVLVDSSCPVDTLLQEQKALFEKHKHFFQQKIADPKWASIISSIVPSQFGAIVSNVYPPYQEPIIASILAPIINGGKLSSLYCTETLVRVKEYNRFHIVRVLLPYCIDLSEGGIDRIKRLLKRWEIIILKSDLEKFSQIS